MKTYTLGEVIDNMKLGEVAIKVAGKLSKEFSLDGYRELQDGLFFDEDNHGILKSLRGGNTMIFKGDTIVEEASFVIMPREVYEKIK